MLQLLVAKRFPKVNVKAKIKRIHDAELLQQLGLEVIEMNDPAVLRRRLDEAIGTQVKSQNSESSGRK